LNISFTFALSGEKQKGMKQTLPPVASIPISGGHSVHPVKNRGESFDKVVDQSLFLLPIFH